MKCKGIYLLFLIPALTTCLESPEMTTGIVNGKEKPTVITKSGVLSPNDGNLLFHGELIGKGKDDRIEKGFYWSVVSLNPGINGPCDSIIVPYSNQDDFTYELKSALGDTIYYWRAFAKNSYGYDYGEVQSCTTPKIWVEKNPLMTNSRGRGAVFVIKNIIYMTCGVLLEGSTQASELLEFNITNNLWSFNSLHSFPGENRRDPVVFTIGNYAYIGTGLRGSGYALKDFYRYDNTSRKWDEISIPDEMETRSQASAFSINGKGYVIGGLSAGGGSLEYNDVWQYSPEEDLWEKKHNFPELFSGGLSISGNNRIFVGFGSGATEKKLWEYNAENDSWIDFFTLPDNVKSKIYSGVIVHNTIYLVDEDKLIWTLNLSDRTWRKKTNLPDCFPNKGDIEMGRVFQTLLTTGNNNSIYIGLGFSQYLYEYRPLWDN